MQADIEQYVFIGSASAYQKPQKDYLIIEDTLLENPYWGYSRNKIACEDWLMEQYRENGFPVTIVRSSHTYDERSVPVGLQRNYGSWQVVKRMLAGKPVIIHGEAVQIISDERLTWNRIYETLAEAVDYIMDHPELQKEDAEFDAWCDRVIEPREQELQWMHAQSL